VIRLAVTGRWQHDSKTAKIISLSSGRDTVTNKCGPKPTGYNEIITLVHME